MKVGEHRGPQNGFGAAHIWAAHQNDLRKLGYASPEDVVRYVARIIQTNVPIYCEFSSMRKAKLALLKSPVGLLIVEHRPLAQPDLAYSVITAYPKTQAHGTLVGRIEKAP